MSSSDFCDYAGGFVTDYATPPSTYLCPAGNFCIDKSLINYEISYKEYYMLTESGLSNKPFADCKEIQGGTVWQCPCNYGQFCLENSTSPQFCPTGA